MTEEAILFLSLLNGMIIGSWPIFLDRIFASSFQKTIHFNILLKNITKRASQKRWSSDFELVEFLNSTQCRVCANLYRNLYGDQRVAFESNNRLQLIEQTILPE